MTIQADNFIARTSGFGPLRTAAYRALIDGLVGNGVFAKLDYLKIYATLDTTNAVLNLISTSYTSTFGVQPTFTVDAGFTGTDSSTTIYINSNFTPSTAGGNYTQNAATIAVWSLAGSSNIPAVGTFSSTTPSMNLYPFFGSNSFYVRINDAAGDAPVTPIFSPVGLFAGVRSASNLTTQYINAVSQGTTADASTGLPVNPITECGSDTDGSTYLGSNYQIAAVAYGGALTGTDMTNLYNALNTYMALLPFGPDTATTVLMGQAVF